MNAPLKKTLFQWQDPFLFEDQLTEDERIVQNSARIFCQDQLFPLVREAHRNESFDRKIFQSMGGVGFLGANLKGYGCAGVNNVCYGLITREIERVDSGYRSMMSVQTSLVMYPIYTFGTEKQKKKYLPKLAKGE